MCVCVYVFIQKIQEKYKFLYVDLCWYIEYFIINKLVVKMQLFVLDKVLGRNMIYLKQMMEESVLMEIIQ